LGSLVSADQAADALYEKEIISAGEKSEVQITVTEERKRSILCKMLTAKGASSLVEVSEILTMECKKWCDSSSPLVVTTSSSTSSSSTETFTSGSGRTGDSEPEEGKVEEKGRGLTVTEHGQDGDARGYNGKL
jgi:hypothetical protein